jgi:hypothetical protein
MGAVKLTKRDFEVLRTMVRVQLVRTRSLQWVFFPNMGVARRRLRVLRGYGLVTTHRNGLPGNLAVAGGQYWRVTGQGLEVMLQNFTEEFEPENFIARIRRASLRCFEHRDEMTDTYLRLIYSQDQDWDDISARANMLHWRGEYEVELGLTEMGAGKKSKIIPDATLTTIERRIFIEVDRSTESHARCKRTIERYDSSIRFGHYRKRFPDERPVTVLYITKSDRRAAGLQKLMDAGFRELSYQGLALSTRRATEWLRSATVSPGDEETVAPDSDYSAACGLLRRLYDDYQKDLAEREAQGYALPATTESLMDTYNFLRSLRGGQQ